MNIALARTDGRHRLIAGDIRCDAAIGRNGLIDADKKREGDGKTPIGIWPLRCLYYRPDRLTLPSCSLTTAPITKEMGWCDDPGHSSYNQLVDLPFGGSHEAMWRDDHAYDIVIPLGYNDLAPEAGRGSAIFMHLLHDGKNETAGCIAIPRDQMLAILPEVTTSSVITVKD
jgi:L,D-peptidoglycan transpeptidase YkuD (ErfK/YbiS/YcfS/YnhG family)